MRIEPKLKLMLHQRLVSVALLCLVVALGTGLRFYQLGDESYWIDEVKMASVTGGDLESVLAEMQASGRPPVFVLLAHVWIGIFGPSEAAARSLSALFSAVSLIVIYLVGRKLFGRGVALMSTLLMTISESQIYYAQEFRYYSLFLLLSLFSFLFYIQALQTEKKRYWALYVLSSALSFYTHTFALLYHHNVARLEVTS